MQQAVLGQRQGVESALERDLKQSGIDNQASTNSGIASRCHGCKTESLSANYLHVYSMHFDNFFYFSGEHTTLNPRAHPQKAWGTPTHPPGVPPCMPLHSDAGRVPARGAVADSISPHQIHQGENTSDPRKGTAAREHQRAGEARHSGEHHSRINAVFILCDALPCPV